MRSLRNPDRKPTHPGAVLCEDVLPELSWTQAELAERLRVSRQTVSDLLHERKSVTAEMAVRIAREVGGSPESWLHMQQALDIWAAETKFKKQPITCTQSVCIYRLTQKHVVFFVNPQTPAAFQIFRSTEPCCPRPSIAAPPWRTRGGSRRWG